MQFLARLAVIPLEYLLQTYLWSPGEDFRLFLSKTKQLKFAENLLY
jgi:hypothetical protein